MRAWLRWLARHGPAPGWASLLLLAAALLCPGLSFAAVGWHREGWLVVPALLLGGAIGYVLGAIPLRAAWAWVTLALAGGEVAVVFAARALPHPVVVWLEVQRAVRWHGALSTGHFPREPLPGWPLLMDGADRIAALAADLLQWGRGLAAGQPAFTLAPFLVLSLWAAWLVGAAGGWGLPRRHHPLAALAPAGVALVLNALYAPLPQTPWLLAFLASAFLLALRARWVWLLRRWGGRGVDYPDELGLEFHALGGAVVGAVVFASAVLAPTLSGASPRRVADFFWERWGEPLLRMDRGIREAFPPLNQQGAGVPVMPGGPGRLPREHLLGGNPALSREFAFAVSVSPSDGVPLLWRQTVYDVYTGRGWSQGQVAEQKHPGGVLDPAPGPEGRREVVQEFRWGTARERPLAYLGEPSWLGPAGRLYIGPDGTLWAAIASARSYRVVSLVPNVAEEFLEAAGEAYPPWAQAFLQLPPLPEGVLAWVREATAGLDTPYERAQALEERLRAMEYALDVPLPPPGRDVAAYLILDLQRGYCDLFATAMAVAARVAGIPSRLAVGYAGGTYREDCRCFWVTEAHAHSWAELYFPGVGWVPFEATPAFPVPARVAVEDTPAASLIPSEPLVPVPQPRTPARRVALWVGTGLGLALLAGAAFAGWREVRFRRSGPREQAQALYGRLVRWGRWLGVAWAPHQTPLEFALRLAEGARDTLQGHRRELAGEIQAEVYRFARSYAALLYGPPGPTDAARERVRQLRRQWGHLRGLCARWWVRRWLGGVAGGVRGGEG